MTFPLSVLLTFWLHYPAVMPSCCPAVTMVTRVVVVRLIDPPPKPSVWIEPERAARVP